MLESRACVTSMLNCCPPRRVMGLVAVPAVTEPVPTTLAATICSTSFPEELAE